MLNRRTLIPWSCCAAGLALLWLATLFSPGQAVALAQAEAKPAASTAVTYPLPTAWNGPASIPAAELNAVAPPLQVVEKTGAFRIDYSVTDAGNSLRILPDQSAEVPGTAILFGWPITVGSEAVLPAGAFVTLSARARVYSPPDGASLTIREQGGADAGSSSVAMRNLEWTPYTVTRQIDPEASALLLGIDWKPGMESAWLEVRELQVMVEAAPPPGSTVAPTDTPTPIPTPSPAGAPAGENVAAEPTQPAQPRPLVIVTATPTPPDVFVAATQVAIATEWAEVLGTSTPTPANLVTATYTPTPLVITPTPKPGNAATATFVAEYATAVAVTTGTPTPLPEGAELVVATATPPPTARPTARPAGAAGGGAGGAARTPNPTPTPRITPIFVYVDQLTFPTPTATPVFPADLMGKILFKSNYLARQPRQPSILMINPDGTGLAVLSSTEFYDRAKERDAYSADKRLYAYALKEPLGGNSARVQVYYDDAEYGSTGHQLTYFGAGTAWAPAWSPTRDSVVLVSSESDNDEIWLVDRNTWPGIQLTKNEWEWDLSPSFSPDGSEIVFASNRGSGKRQLWVMDGGGGNVRQLTDIPLEAWDPVWVKYPDS